MSKPRDVMEINEIGVFEVLNNRFRHQILRELVSPKPVKEVAEALGVPVTRLYYHVNLLLDAGVIHVVEERKAGAILEKILQTTAMSFRPGAGLLSSGRPPDEMARVAASIVLDPARVDAEAHLARHFAAGATTDELPGAFGRGQSRLSKARAEELTEKVYELLDMMKEGDDGDDDDSVEFSLSVIFVPMEGADR